MSDARVSTGRNSASGRGTSDNATGTTRTPGTSSDAADACERGPGQQRPDEAIDVSTIDGDGG